MRAKQMKISWQKVYELWLSQNVPMLEVRKYDPNLSYFSVWVDKVPRPGSWFTSSNPQNDTARFLLKKEFISNPEVHAAFAILAYLKSQQEQQRCSWEFAYNLKEATESALKSAGQLYYFWSGNAKHVLVGIADFERQGKFGSWQEFVLEAAEYWTIAAEQLALVRLPKYMERDSDEFQESIARSEIEFEQKERAEYERLKRKYKDD